MKKKKVLYLIAFITCGITIAYCIYQLSQYYGQNAEQQNIFAELDRVSTVQNVSNPTHSDKKNIQEPSISETAYRDITMLQEINSDCIGWIFIPNTSISYPLMQQKETLDFYLSADFNKAPSVHGVPYLDSRCNLNSDILIVYGHHMNDGSMFSELHNYRSKEYTIDHSEIALETVDGINQYAVYAIMLVPGTYKKGEMSVYQTADYQQDSDHSTLLRYIHKNSLFLCGEDPEEDEQLLILSTCEYSQANGRLVVIARKV